jgi:hypothetical protein
MPRVHQMRTDLAQFYQSTKPSIRLQYMTSKEEKVNFELNGTKLLLRDFNVYPVAGAVNRGVIEELKKMVISNNTSGASIDELGSLLTAKTLGQMHRIFKKIEQKAQDRYQQEQESTRQTEQEKLQVELQKLKLEQDFDARQAELDRQTDIIVAEIRAAGYGAGVDKDRNAQNDYLDALGMIQASSEYQQKMGLENSKLQSKFELERQKIGLAREKMNTQLSAKNIDLAIARENKTQAELKNLRTKNARDKKKK